MRTARRIARHLEPLLSVGQVCALFGRSRNWVRARVKAGELEAFKDKGGLMILERAVREYLERCRLVIRKPAPAPAPAPAASIAASVPPESDEPTGASEG